VQGTLDGIFKGLSQIPSCKTAHNKRKAFFIIILQALKVDRKSKF
jgi:hypothetical protein